MNIKHIITATAIAFVGASAFAAEYTNFDIPAGSTLTRAEAKAHEVSRVLGRQVRYYGDAAVFDLPSPTSAAERSAVASQVLGRTVIFNEATTFIDATPATPERMAQVLGRRVR